MKNVALNEANSLQERIEKLDAEIAALQNQPVTADDKLLAIQDTLRRAHELLARDLQEANKNVQYNLDKKQQDKASWIAAFNARRQILIAARATVLGSVAPVNTSKPRPIGSGIY